MSSGEARRPRLRYSARLEGAEGLALDATGGLLIRSAIGVLRDSPLSPTRPSATRARPQAAGTSSWNPATAFTQRITIPAASSSSTPIWTTPHSSAARATSSARVLPVDSVGNAYVVGVTQSPNFTDHGRRIRPHRRGKQQPGCLRHEPERHRHGDSVFHIRGRNHFEWGRGIAVDSSNNVYVTGRPSPPTFRPPAEPSIAHLTWTPVPAADRSVRRVRLQVERRGLVAWSTRPSWAASTSMTAWRSPWTPRATPMWPEKQARPTSRPQPTPSPAPGAAL